MCNGLRSCTRQLSAWLLEAAPELFVLKCIAGWEDIVLFHIGRCARLEFGIKAAFYNPLVRETLWLEATMSSSLKDWLAEIPGVVWRNQQVVLYAISSEESQVLFVPRLDLHYHADEWLHSTNCDSDPMLFNCTLVEDTGFCVAADQILEQYAELFVNSVHPLIGASMRSLPRVVEWCFEIGEIVNNVSTGMVGVVAAIRDSGLEVNFADGLHVVGWAYCRKAFNVGTYVEITGEALSSRWFRWVHASDNGFLHLISQAVHESQYIELWGVHPNSVCAINPPNYGPIALNNGPSSSLAISEIPWKGVMVHIIKCRHCWCGKTGYVIDGIVAKDAVMKKEHLLFLVQLACYDPNVPFLFLWFWYFNLVEEDSWLPLNEARPITNNIEFIRGLVPNINVSQKRGRKRCAIEPPPQQRSVIPLLDPAEQSLSPAWNPSSPDPLSYWCLDRRLVGAKFRMLYNGLQITVLVKQGDSLDAIDCIRDDTSLGETLDLARVVVIHLRVRHYDMFLVISSEHCGKWVRSVQFHK
ncbi:hypothetical protein EDD18DRAFT_1116076 [Armillaria luteobubalina]|uniref:Uncharacterized protein n=1 Tax=Armillaria luteobubalina TaxID=153913 RepID=A0AA39U6H0_9AGAR|nr:hypothetical protein EDD18DRAFT_1116076 [Armillaria luteobubalina]